MANVKRNTTKKNITKEGGEAKKEFVNQNFKMRGKITNATVFGKNEEHIRVTIVDDVSSRKYVFVLFKASDKDYDIIAESDKLEIYFNISYNNYNNQIQLQLVATEIHTAD